IFALLSLFFCSLMLPAEAAEPVPAKAEMDNARNLLKEHKYKQADNFIQSLIKTYPNDADLHMLRADLLRETGQVDQASAEFAEAAELAPANPYPTIALAQLSLKQLELDQSLSYAQQSVARDPSCLAARITLVDVLLQCEQTGEAERQLRYFPASAKGNPAVELLTYHMSLKKGDLSAARLHLQNAIKGSKEDNLQLRLEQCDLLQQLGDNSAVKQELLKIIDEHPDSLSARLRLARLEESQFHNYADALYNFNEALKIDPLSAAAIAGRDRCLLKRSNLALQIKIALREFWARMAEIDKPKAENKP
ncbi:MAG: tetratricopeptide repeat protein, partial [Candidatus Obscuribacterales bacterium]|nr:tetratricopeptide repeat protein [Candidatus Obscuribacterales bacterium]